MFIKKIIEFDYIEYVTGFAINSTGNIFFTDTRTTISTFYPQLVCFKEDTQILTKNGYKPIQNLQQGDLVKTINDYKPIFKIGKKVIYHRAINEKIPNQLYACSTKEYPELFDDMIITGSHSLLVDSLTSDEQKEVVDLFGELYVTENKYRLPICKDNRASVYEIPGKYTIYHLSLEHDNYFMNYGIYANGLLVESCSKHDFEKSKLK